MKSILALLFLFTVNAHAYIVPTYRDLKPATQKMVEAQSILNPSAANSTGILSANAGNTSGAAVVQTTLAGQPDVPRNVTITPGGSTGDVAACDVVVAGTDYFDHAISDTISVSANQASIATGVKAFKSVTSVTFPALCEDPPYQATWYVGLGEKLGVKNCLDKAGHIFHSTLNGAKEATAPTMAVDSSVVSLNTADFNGTMNGSNDFELFFMQNFQCTR